MKEFPLLNCYKGIYYEKNNRQVPMGTNSIIKN